MNALTSLATAGLLAMFLTASGCAETCQLTELVDDVSTDLTSAEAQADGERTRVWVQSSDCVVGDPCIRAAASKHAIEVPIPSSPGTYALDTLGAQVCSWEDGHCVKLHGKLVVHEAALTCADDGCVRFDADVTVDGLAPEPPTQRPARAPVPVMTGHAHARVVYTSTTRPCKGSCDLGGLGMFSP